MVPEIMVIRVPLIVLTRQRFNSDTNPNAVVWGPVDLSKNGTFTGYINKVKVSPGADPGIAGRYDWTGYAATDLFTDPNNVASGKCRRRPKKWMSIYYTSSKRIRVQTMLRLINSRSSRSR